MFKLFFLNSLSFIISILFIISLSQAAPFDFYAFSQGWPGTACHQEHCISQQVQKAEKSFLIHGLWPDYNNGSYPQYCGEGNPFSESVLQPIISQLHRFWPSLYNSYSSFWSHEWEKHGRCTHQYFPTELDFFQHVIELRQKIDLLGALNTHGIQPSTDQYYTLNTIVKAIRSELGVTPFISCDGHDLGEIWLGIDQHNSKIINFPSEFLKTHHHNMCGGGEDPNFKIRILPFPQQ